MDVKARDAQGRFLPNTVPNPKGRPPKSHCVSDLLRDLLTGDPKKIIEKWNQLPRKTGAMQVAIAWYKKLSSADMTALKEALDRVEGKVPQAITGLDDSPLIPRGLTINVMDDKTKAEIDRLRMSVGKTVGKDG